MFTFGIFTTHFPYIAVVAFYAYFLIFGVNKAANGEIEVSEIQFKTEIQSSRSYANLNDNSNYYDKANIDFYLQAHFEESVFRRKIKYQCNFHAEIPETGFNDVHYSRPPPLFI